LPGEAAGIDGFGSGRWCGAHRGSPTEVEAESARQKRSRERIWSLHNALIAVG
jgi:hypothetical protein